MNKKFYVLGQNAESFNDGSLSLSLGKKDIGVVDADHPNLRNLAAPLRGKHLMEISESGAHALVTDEGYTLLEPVLAPASAPTNDEGAEDENDLNTGNNTNAPAGGNEDDEDEEDEFGDLETKSDFIESLKENDNVTDEDKAKLTKMNLAELKATYLKYKA